MELIDNIRNLKPAFLYKNSRYDSQCGSRLVSYDNSIVSDCPGIRFPRTSCSDSFRRPVTWTGSVNRFVSLAPRRTAVREMQYIERYHSNGRHSTKLHWLPFEFNVILLKLFHGKLLFTLYILKSKWLSNVATYIGQSRSKLLGFSNFCSKRDNIIATVVIGGYICKRNIVADVY